MKNFYACFIITLVILITIISFSCDDDQGTAPNSPTLTSPVNNATNVSIQPTLVWAVSSSASSYSLQVATDSLFTIIFYNQNGIKNTSQQITGLSSSTKYYWRVNAANSYGTSGWSATWLFSTGDAPANPSLISPPNNATSVSIQPTLTWNAISGALSYELQVSTSGNFSSFIYDQSGLTATSQQVNGLNSSTTYYWRVNAANSYGTSGWSSTWLFTTGDAPLAPILVSPSNNATSQPLQLTLSWGASGGAMSYTLQVSTSGTFSSFIYNQSGLTATSQELSGLNSYTRYYWRVNATNSYGTSGWSTVWNFETIFICGTSQVTYSGKTYNTVVIGTQCWLKENLDVGTMIHPSVDATNNGVIEKYCLENLTSKCNTYGGLYQWSEAMQYSTSPGAQGICPSGWHIPTYSEFQTLKTSVGDDGNALKAVGQGYGAGAGTNTSGFTGLLAGARSHLGYTYGESAHTNFWISTQQSASDARYLYLLAENSFIGLDLFLGKSYGISIRCLKD